MTGDSKAYRDPTTLRRLYHGRGLSVREVATRLGCGPTTVHDWLSTYGIETRDEPAALEAARAAQDDEDDDEGEGRAERTDGVSASVGRGTRQMLGQQFAEPDDAGARWDRGL